MNFINHQQISVGLSDFLISVLAFAVGRQLKFPASKLWFVYFIVIGFVAMLGGIYHLFTPILIKPPLSSFIWYIILILIGLVTMIGWRLYLWMCWEKKINSTCTLNEGLIYVSYCVFVYFYPYFKVAGVFFACMALCHILFGFTRYFQKTSLAWGYYALGWTTYMMGAVIQFLDISWDAILLSNNTLYHLITSLAIGIIYVALKKIIISEHF